MLKRLLSQLLILLSFASCDELIRASNKDMTKTIDEYVPSRTLYPIRDFKFQKKIEHHLESKLAEVEELQILQNKESYPVLLKMVENSKKYFFMNVLSFDCDEVTEILVQGLTKKASQGVDVRLITNKYFSYLTLSCLKRLESSGVKVSKSRTHASYFLNDQNELLIGSQSVARMFFLADGFNYLDRDMMAYLRGPPTTDALKDFSSTWIEEEDGGDELLALIKEKSEVPVKAYDEISDKHYCRFSAERPFAGVTDIQETVKQMSSVSEENIIFSGVRVEIPTHPISKILKEKSLQNSSVSYIGNGPFSGDGELTMVMDEWIGAIKKTSFAFLADPLVSIRNWDVKRVADENAHLYQSIRKDSKINFLTYPQFIHYKVWAFDFPAFFIGSANLDETKFGKVTDAGVFCLSPFIYKNLKQHLVRDMKNSTIEGHK